MGMSIEEIRYRLQAMATMCTFQDTVGHDLSQKEIKLYNQAKDQAVDIMRKYQKLQANYENRLKADMVAMLKELDLQIDEIPIVTRHGEAGTVMTAQGMRKKIKQNIQQKIDALKEQTDAREKLE